MDKLIRSKKSVSTKRTTRKAPNTSEKGQQAICHRPAIGFVSFVIEAIGEAILYILMGLPAWPALTVRIVILILRALHVHRTAHESVRKVRLIEIAIFAILLTALQGLCHAMEVGELPHFGAVP